MVYGGPADGGPPPSSEEGEMTPVHLSVFDAFLSFFAAMGLIPAIRVFMKAESSLPLEKALKWILISLFFMMAFRVPVFALDDETLSPIVYSFSMAAIFFIFIYFEILLRKHFPLWLKIFVTGGTIGFSIDTILNDLPRNRDHLIVFSGFLAIAILSISLICLARKRKEYTRIENPMIDLNIFAVLIMVPLLLSDITKYKIEGLPRFGVLGILLFVFVAVYNQVLYRGRRHMFAKLLVSFFFSVALSTATVYLIQDWSLAITGRLFILFFSVNLIFRINLAVKQLSGEEDFFIFVQAVNAAEKDRVLNFLHNVDQFFGRLDKKVLRKSDLSCYNVTGINSLFQKTGTHLLNILDIKDILASSDQRPITHGEMEIYEQVIDILEKNEMSYICRFGEKAPVFVLFHIPIVGYRKMIEMKTALISEITRLMEDPSSSKAPLDIQ